MFYIMFHIEQGTKEEHNYIHLLVCFIFFIFNGTKFLIEANNLCISIYHKHNKLVLVASAVAQVAPSSHYFVQNIVDA